MNGSNHIVDKVFLNINSGTLEEGEYIKNHISAVLENSLLPYLEKQFSAYDKPDRLLRFEKLNFEIIVSSWNDIEKLSIQVKSQFHEQLAAIRMFSAADGSGFGTDWESVPSEIRNKMVEQSHEVLSFENNRENVFLFFLERGYLPWYGNENHVSEISESKIWYETLNNNRFISRLSAILQHNDEALDRFQLQFSLSTSLMYYFHLAHVPESLYDNFERLIHLLPSALAKCLLKILILIGLNSNNERIKLAEKCFPAKIESSGLTRSQLSEANNLWNPIYKRFLSKQGISGFNGANFLSSVFENVILKKEEKEFSERPPLKQTIKTESSEQEIDFSVQTDSEEARQDKQKENQYFEFSGEEVTTSSAGLILMHPFLYTFLERSKITVEKGIIPSGMSSQAIQALRYLAVGNENFFGGSMVLEKFICGLALKFPVERESLLSQEIKTEAENLLTEVIRQWPILRNTSPDGLRQMFIQRQGKLMQTRDGFKLLVERKAQDVLLRKLHWNYSVIKFPWRKELLFVEW